MKCFVILVVSLVYTGNASPIDLDIEKIIPKDNSHYVAGESRYIWMPDGKSELHLVDLFDTAEETPLASARNGQNNEYWLYTRLNPTTPQNLVFGDVNSILNSNYNPGWPLKVVVHGWNGGGNDDVNVYIRDAFLEVCDCNVIVVNWRASGLYNIIYRRVPSVGQYLGNFLVWLFNTAGGNWDNVHLVGYSLGAHVVGNAGRTAGSQPARITGLDPAGPQFGGNSDALNANDGKYVEAIHTSGGTLGINDPIGRTNFYPNGGRSQPGCILYAPCSHGRSYKYFASSVITNHFVANQCSSLSEANRNVCTGPTLNMGNDILTKTGEGFYALTTDSSWPY